jgi:hypothetical protein
MTSVYELAATLAAVRSRLRSAEQLLAEAEETQNEALRQVMEIFMLSAHDKSRQCRGELSTAVCLTSEARLAVREVDKSMARYLRKIRGAGEMPDPSRTGLLETAAEVASQTGHPATAAALQVAAAIEELAWSAKHAGIYSEEIKESLRRTAPRRPDPPG